MSNAQLAIFMLCYTTHSDIATKADIKVCTCGSKNYTLAYVVEDTSKWLIRHIRDPRNLKGSLH